LQLKYFCVDDQPPRMEMDADLWKDVQFAHNMDVIVAQYRFGEFHQLPAFQEMLKKRDEILAREAEEEESEAEEGEGAYRYTFQEGEGEEHHDEL
jgi:hypothetical protein